MVDKQVCVVKSHILTVLSDAADANKGDEVDELDEIGKTALIPSV